MLSEERVRAVEELHSFFQRSVVVFSVERVRALTHTHEEDCDSREDIKKKESDTCHRKPNVSATVAMSIGKT